MPLCSLGVNCTICNPSYEYRNGENERMPRFENVVQRHSPRLAFLRTDDQTASDTKLYFGIELELEYAGEGFEAPRIAANAITEMFTNLAQIKGDGSLDNGVELASQPSSFEYHRDNYGWREKLRRLAEVGLAARRTCGIHIHASRAGFTEDGLRRMLNFVYANENRQFMQFIARRNPSSWASLDVSPPGANGSIRGGSRYVALNLNNSATVEFRLFAATLDYSVFMSSLEFVRALIRFCDVPTRLLRSMKTSNFFTWLINNARADYPNLHNFMLGFPAYKTIVDVHDREVAERATASARLVEAVNRAERRTVGPATKSASKRRAAQMERRVIGRSMGNRVDVGHVGRTGEITRDSMGRYRQNGRVIPTAVGRRLEHEQGVPIRTAAS